MIERHTLKLSGLKGWGSLSWRCFKGLDVSGLSPSSDSEMDGDSTFLFLPGPAGASACLGRRCDFPRSMLVESGPTMDAGA